MKMFNRFLSMCLFPVALAACSVDGGDAEGPERARGAVGKADGLGGSCEADGGNTCGGQSPDGCWCDEQCAQFGDCCDDAAPVCEVDECTIEGDGCGEGEVCAPGVCLAFCLVEDPDCCAPNECVPDGGGETGGGQDDPCAPQDAQGQGLCQAFFGFAWNGEACVGLSGCSCVGEDCDETFFDPAECEAAHAECIDEESPTCEDLGGTCKSSPIDVTFGANCEEDFGVPTLPGSCEAINQSCCGKAEEPECGEVFCALACEEFQKDENGCDICACAEPDPEPASCEGQCGGASTDGSCFCDDACEGLGDCCEDYEAQCLPGEACGDTVCEAGTVCCNASCGICTPPGFVCTQQACL